MCVEGEHSKLSAKTPRQDCAQPLEEPLEGVAGAE